MGCINKGWYSMFVVYGIWCIADVSSVSPLLEQINLFWSNNKQSPNFKWLTMYVETFLSAKAKMKIYRPDKILCLSPAIQYTLSQHSTIHFLYNTASQLDTTQQDTAQHSDILCITPQHSRTTHWQSTTKHSTYSKIQHNKRKVCLLWVNR